MQTGRARRTADGSPLGEALHGAAAERHQLLRQPARIALRYALLALVWLTSTDLLLAHVLPLTQAQRWLFVILKGTLFIAVTSAVIMLLQKRALRTFLQRDALVQSLIRGYADLFYHLDVPALILHEENGRIVDANEVAQRVLAYPPEALHGMQFDNLRAGTVHAVWPALGDGGPMQVRTGQGDEIALQWSASRLDDGCGSVVMLVGSEVTAQKHSEDLRKLLSDSDPLTGLASRSWLCSRIDAAIAQDPHRCLAVALLDLDHFRLINEVRGHNHGDNVLRSIAARLRGFVDEHTHLARFGGDEFVLLACGAGSPESARALGEEVRAAVAANIADAAGGSGSGSCSLGLALYPEHGADADTLLAAADMALAQAKHAGRDRLVTFEPALRAREWRHAELAQNLRVALDSAGLHLVYQPQYGLHGECVIGMEALVRWYMPDGTEVPVADFVAVAERSGLIHALGRWVLREGARQLVDWRKRGVYQGGLAINVSPQQLLEEDFVDFIAGLLVDHALPAEVLELELTETVAMHAGDEIQARVNALAALGVGIAIDDFGTGYSSLSHFKRLRVTKVKIDMLFVRNVHQAPDNQAIVSAMLGMTGALGLTVVAEGVEQVAEAEWLRAQGCDAVQGYLYARPQSPDNLELHLAMSQLELAS